VEVPRRLRRGNGRRTRHRPEDRAAREQGELEGRKLWNAEVNAQNEKAKRREKDGEMCCQAEVCAVSTDERELRR
jgi:hypothetical protein